MLQPSISRFH